MPTMNILRCDHNNCTTFSEQEEGTTDQINSNIYEDIQHESPEVLIIVLLCSSVSLIVILFILWMNSSKSANINRTNWSQCLSKEQDLEYQIIEEVDNELLMNRKKI